MIKKLLAVVSVFIIVATLFINEKVNAFNINNANMVAECDCGQLITYKGVVVKTTYVDYLNNGKKYPAYCLDVKKPGVEPNFSYYVSVRNTISDLKLWKIIINGYPYKTLNELGVQTKEEAFTATKHAIYCYIHGNDRTQYKPIGDAGQRTINALNKILDDANNSKETQIANEVTINIHNKEFNVDNINKNMVSKEYSISAKTDIKDYKVSISSNEELPEGMKITDVNNKEKNEFLKNEKFKILIPIKNLKFDGNFDINIETQINSKPVLYGKEPAGIYQDYALTGETYEDAKGHLKDYFYKNQTKVKVVKQDKDTKERLENVRFNILNENKELLYVNLVTDKNGEIKLDNLIPGTYYIQETSTKEDYILDDSLVKFSLKLNEEFTITINNKFEKTKENKPEIEKNENSVEIINNGKEEVPTKKSISTDTIEKTFKKPVKKLPVTGF